MSPTPRRSLYTAQACRSVHTAEIDGEHDERREDGAGNAIPRAVAGSSRGAHPPSLQQERKHDVIERKEQRGQQKEPRHLRKHDDHRDDHDAPDSAQCNGQAAQHRRARRVDVADADENQDAQCRAGSSALPPAAGATANK